MNGRYLYVVGDKVLHGENTNLVGTIVSLCGLVEGVRDDTPNEDDPWYTITWDDGSYGFEHEYSLLPEFVNPTPVKFINHMYNSHRELWRDVVDDVT